MALTTISYAKITSTVGVTQSGAATSWSLSYDQSFAGEGGPTGIDVRITDESQIGANIRTGGVCAATRSTTNTVFKRTIALSPGGLLSDFFISNAVIHGSSLDASPLFKDLRARTLS